MIDLENLVKSPRRLGIDDCVTIPARVLREAKNIRLLNSFKGPWYNSERGFLKVLARNKDISLESAIERACTENGGVLVTGNPAQFDLGYSNYKPTGGKVHCLPVIYIDGFWTGFFHSKDQTRNLVTCLGQAEKAWRF